MPAETFVIHFSSSLCPLCWGLGFWRGITHTLWSEPCGVFLQQRLRSWAAGEMKEEHLNFIALMRKWVYSHIFLRGKKFISLLEELPCLPQLPTATES